jgi:hypothetical protein
MFLYLFDLFAVYLTTLQVSQTTGTPPTYELPSFRKALRQRNFTQVQIQHTHGCLYLYVQGDQKVSVHLMITIHKATSNVQSVPRQSSDIY